MEMMYISARKCVCFLLFVSTSVLILWYIKDRPNSKHGRQRLEYVTEARGSLLTHIQIDNINQLLDEATSYEEPINQRCLHSNPPALKEEFIPNFRGSKGGYVCSGDYKRHVTWDINFNIERNFCFCSSRDGCKRSNVTGIPKVIHFIWSTDVVPNMFVNNLKGFHRLHPKWAMHFWTLKSGREFIKTHEIKLLTYFDHYKRDVDRADLLRYVILYYYGGAYFDLDSTPVKPLDALIDKYDCIVSPEPIENAVVILQMRSVLANSGIMCVRNHGFIRFLIDSLPKHGRRMAGPLFFSNCFNTYLRYRLSPATLKVKHGIGYNNVLTDNVDRISVVRHEYFEYYLNNIINISEIMSKECPRYKLEIKEYWKDCTRITNRSTLTHCNILPSNNVRSTKLFQACAEWLGHGGSKRTAGKSHVFLKHIHYGTYTKSNFILHNPGPNVLDVLPNAILHV